MARKTTQRLKGTPAKVSDGEAKQTKRSSAAPKRKEDLRRRAQWFQQRTGSRTV